MTRKKSLLALAFFIDKTGDITNFFLSKTHGSMASARIQVLPAINSAKTCGIELKVASLDSEQPGDFFEIGNPSYCLIGKMSANTQEKAHQMIIANLAAIFRLKGKGCKIITLYCDNIFDQNNILSDFYADIFSVSDHIIFPSEALKAITSKYIHPKTKTHVILDPWQITKQHIPRKLENKDQIKLLWFGSNKNIDYLLEVFPNLLSSCNSSNSYELTILGTKYSINRVCDLVRDIKPNCKNWCLRLVEWNIKDQPNQLEAEVTRAHISLIPSDPDDPLKAGVSHNRLVDSIRGGCITVASSLRSYMELSEICLLGEDLPALINQATENYDHYASQINYKSDQLLKKFSPESNANSWMNFWESILQK